MSTAAVHVVHPCLEARAGVLPLPEAHLTDRQRLALLLEAAGLLSLLDRAGWHAEQGFGAAGVTAEGRLALALDQVATGRPTRQNQELLRDLLVRLFNRRDPAPSDRFPGVAGRGTARRAARALAAAWRQALIPLSADQAVTQILEAAPFLWEQAFAGSRLALAGEIHQEDGETRLWVAGPRPFRARVLAPSAGSRAKLAETLGGATVRELWQREEIGDARALAASRRWRAAVAAWGLRPPVSEAERLELSGALAALGRFEAALATLAAARSVAARTQRARCQLQLGRLGAARATLRRLHGAPVSPGEAVELAEVAARVFANSGEPELTGAWVRRALAAARAAGAGQALVRAHLVAAVAAWDGQDTAAMDRHLARVEAEKRLARDPSVAWRWHQARGLRALAAGEGRLVVEQLGLAIRANRRQLCRHEAAGLWNDLGVGRALAGDLAGAERSFLHAVRLFSGCDGPRPTTLALVNLAEMRLRRGRLAGVPDILERSAAENRLAGNLRGLTQDTELSARLELVLGRPGAALELCRTARRELDRHGFDWRRAGLSVLAARALGWLGRAGEAAAELAGTTAASRAELEPEERPALWAHAGDRARALREAAEQATAAAELWLRLLAGEDPAASAWDALAALEPFRAARLVFDLELAAPRSVPRSWLRAAIGTFRGLGASPLAESLEAAGEGGPWRGAFTAPDPGAGLEPGTAGKAEDGPAVDASGGGGEEETGRRAGRDAGMIGDSPALHAALERIALLAPAEIPVLIVGESGTGKELAARHIHRASRRATAPMLAINCAALAESLLLSDLFGHVRGAFTGADRDRAGVFETADGGTVLLDEIGDLPAAAQGMLLRLLQEGEVRRVGESLPRRVRVRVLAATHCDLARKVAAGEFRQDLFYRLKVGSVELPPLRDRGSDVLLLADHFLARLGATAAFSRQPPRLSHQARDRLLRYRWPGNVRELQNVLAVAAALAGGGTIAARHLDLPDDSAAPGEGSYHQQVDALRRRLVQEALAASGGRCAEAARRLGISRQALSYLVRQLGLK
ncbi:MAG TPA: sigma 54-interacting transcriptional regulator [Thermoanaerobaculia bacterium]|nr:sigma 54-interacting transcriptional regulator [Thermoanaerobaculia bacterium]